MWIFDYIEDLFLGQYWAGKPNGWRPSLHSQRESLPRLPSYVRDWAPEIKTRDTLYDLD
jgi:hypothetical protein